MCLERCRNNKASHVVGVSEQRECKGDEVRDVDTMETYQCHKDFGVG